MVLLHKTAKGLSNLRPLASPFMPFSMMPEKELVYHDIFILWILIALYLFERTLAHAIRQDNQAHVRPPGRIVTTLFMQLYADMSQHTFTISQGTSPYRSICTT